MANMFLTRESSSNVITAEKVVQAYVTGAERRDPIWLSAALCTADGDGNKTYAEGQVLTKRAGTGLWSYPETSVLASAYDPSNPVVCVLVKRVNVGHGDAFGAGYVGHTDFNKANLLNYAENAANVHTHLPTCTFRSVSQAE